MELELQSKLQLKLQKIKSEMSAEIAASFKTVESMNEVSGWPTGLKELDQFLAWQGLPKSALSLFIGQLGLGATSFWIEAAAQVTAQKKWAAWISSEAELFPLPLQQREIDLNRVLAVQNPQDEDKLLWLLQELLSSTLFDLIGCDLDGVLNSKRGLREHQLRKLQTLARNMKTSVVFFTQNERARHSPLFSLILAFKKNGISIERALHRPSPHFIARRISYARFTRYTADPLHTEITFERLQQPSSLPDLASAREQSKK